MAKAARKPRLPSLRKSLNQICEQLVLVDLSDLQALAAMHTATGELAAGLETSHGPAAGALREAGQWLERIIMAEVVPAEGWGQVGRLLAAAQAVVCEGADPVQAGLVAAPVAAADAPPAFAPLPGNVDEAILGEFLARQPAVLEEIEQQALALERVPGPEPARELRRVIHTLKGEAGLLGLTEVETLCHAIESALEREGTAVTDTLLEARDWLAKVWAAREGGGEPPAGLERLLERLAAPAAESVPLTADPDLVGEFVAEAREHLEATDVHLMTIETEPSDGEALAAVFRAFHTIKGVAGFLALEEIGRLAHQSENLLDRARRGEVTLAGPVIDVVFDATDAMKRMVGTVEQALRGQGGLVPEPGLDLLLERIGQAAAGTLKAAAEMMVGTEGPVRRLGEILVETGAASSEGVARALAAQATQPEPERLGTLLVREGEARPRDVVQALRSQRGGAGEASAPVEVRETIKVDTDRLDRLIEMVGELVIVESMVSQSRELRENLSPALARSLAQLDKITRELQEMGMALRMVPLRSTFQKMARLVRDLARKSGKAVELALVGEDTELDKTVVDRIGDPLIHMIRNAVDHGIEPDAQARRAAGKPETGRVELRAFHKGGNIHIEISDDGRGLDPEAILAKARERGLVREGEQLSEREIYGLIFEPGLSTAKKVTDVSGRGVGMDVVKRNIEELRGQVEVTSERGRGSTISIRLPLTLAIIDGMVVRLGGERLIVPTLSIVRSIRPRPEELSSVFGRGEMISVQGKLVPLVRLDDVFGRAGHQRAAADSIVVIVEDGSGQAGLLVDELLGQQQIVIKSLGDYLKGTPGISGGAIMADGRVGLILDVSSIVRLAQADGEREEAVV